MRLFPLVSACVVPAVVVGAVGTASANGRFPYADQLVADPADDKHLVVRTTYGFVQSHDAGASWRWVCEDALAASGEIDAAIGVTGSGNILAGVVSGLSVTADRGCSWSFAAGPLEKQYVIDVAVDAGAPMRAIAITSTAAGAPNVILAETADGGKTWTQAGAALQKDFDALTADTAPSNPKRVYVSGLLGDKAVGTLMRSDDRGVSWSALAITGVGNGQPYIGAVDAKNADVLYVRLADYGGDRLLLSTDGGKSWKEILKVTDRLLGFALSPDGASIAVGGPKDGLLVASRGDHAFAKAGGLSVKCLTWTKSGLLACATEATDGFTLGLSLDKGKTWKGLHHLKELWPQSCPATSPMTKVCTPLWPKTQDKIGQPRDWKPPASWTDPPPASDAGPAPEPEDSGMETDADDPMPSPIDGGRPRDAGLALDGPKGACSMNPHARDPLALLTMLAIAGYLRARRRG